MLIMQLDSQLRELLGVSQVGNLRLYNICSFRRRNNSSMVYDIKNMLYACKTGVYFKY